MRGRLTNVVVAGLGGQGVLKASDILADVALRAGEATPRLEALPPEADYFRAGFLGYVAGQPEERARVPRLSLPPEIIRMPLRLIERESTVPRRVAHHRGE